MKPTGVQAKAGSILIANPQMHDKQFGFSVVYLTRVNADACEGFIINKSMPLLLEDVLPDIPIGQEEIIHSGGPVEDNTFYFLHSSCGNTCHSEQIIPDVYCGYRYTDLIAVLDNEESWLYCFLGYAGWTGAQLAREIRHGDWLVGEAQLWSLMQLPSRTLWQHAMASLGPSYAVWQHFPRHPDWN